MSVSAAPFVSHAGSLPVVVTLGNGVVMSIRDAGEGPDPASPLGDQP